MASRRPFVSKVCLPVAMFMALLSALLPQSRAKVAQDSISQGDNATKTVSTLTGGNSSEPENFSLDVLLAVFEKYGTGEGTIDFRGFEDLLTSLGLGKVQIIEEDIDREHGYGKHDYTVHLDLLDHHGASAQHGHNHSADGWDHIKSHKHNLTAGNNDHTIKDHNPSLHHDHAYDSDPKNGFGDSDEAKQSDHHTRHHNHDQIGYRHQGDDDDRHRDVYPTRDSVDGRSADGSGDPEHSSRSEQNNKSHQSHGLERRATHGDGHKHWHEPHDTEEKCLSPTEILNDFSIHSAAVNMQQFLHICPLLISQIDSRACIQHDNNTHALRTDPSLTVGVPGAVWGWAALSVTVISLVSLFAVAMVPLTKKSFYKYLITFLVALAVGCLSGDAVLHLIPHALGIHGDHEETVQGGHGHETEAESTESVWKGCVVLMGIFIFFIVEKGIGVVTASRCKPQKKEREQPQNTLFQNQENVIGYKLSTTFSEEPETELSLLDNQRVTKDDAHSHDGLSHDHGGHSHSHGGHSHDIDRNAGIATVAWMVIMGDGLHNFADGVTIGAAFAAGLAGGLSTSIAVFCHELPHELGDFAILLKAGMSFKHAITYNIVSGFISFIGMAVGVGLGKSNQVGPWVFALAGGMFLYIALVDMLPELLHGPGDARADSGDTKKTSDSPCAHTLLQTAGLVTGVLLMLLIAIFEDDLKKMLE